MPRVSKLFSKARSNRIYGAARRLFKEQLENRWLMAMDIGHMPTEAVWTDLSDLPPAQVGQVSYLNATAYRALTLDTDNLQSLLRNAPMEFTEESFVNPMELSLPTPDGRFSRFNIVQAPIMEPALAAQFPEIMTYRGQGIDNPADSLRFDITPAGFHAQVLSPEGTYYVDPYWHLDDSAYISYYKKDLMKREGEVWIEDGVVDDHDKDDDHDHDHELLGTTGSSSSSTNDTASTNTSTSSIPSVLDLTPRTTQSTNTSLSQLNNRTSGTKIGPITTSNLERAGSQLRTYRLANAATGEYTAFHGGTVPLGQAAIVTAVNRVTGIYEKEVAVRLVLVGSNSSLVYTNASTDPYTNTNASLLLSQNQTNVDNVIGNANYDIGHVFSTGGGGLAGLGVVGVTGQKARGETGSSAPIADAFYVDYVAHEMGHQFGGNHSFNGVTGNCSGGNRNAGTAYEPGSGSSIQAYAGICGADDLQPNSDPYFHSVSFDEIVAYTTTGIGNSAAAITATGNNVPRVNAGVDWVIPARTPFELNAVGVDADVADSLTYSWEQRDLGAAQLVTNADNGTSPIFRAFSPTASPARTFPRLQELLNNTTVVGEKLPTTTRTLKFRATVRDNKSGGGGVNTDDMQISVVDGGAGFAVTAPNTAVSWASNSSQTVTWNVANTTAAPINTANVDIWLSTNGGTTFPILLAANTPNDGSQTITVPNIATTTARIKVSASNSIYFDVSNANFSILSGTNTAPTVSDVTNKLITMNTASGAISFTIGDAQTSAASLTVAASSSNTTLIPNANVVIGGSGANRTVTVTPALGQFGQSTISLDVTDAEGLTTRETFVMFVESVVACFAVESFDTVTAPALPAGWTTSATGAAATNWVTSTTGSSNGTNNAFVSNPSNISDSRLTSPVIAINQSNLQFKFKNNYALESGFDGGVLEVSIDSGAFTDFVTAGGTFVSGGYNSSIDPGFSNPLAGRPAWSGSSGGYIDTIAELPQSAIGKNVQFRFRMGSDTSDVLTGWRIDAIQQCGVPLPTILAITATDAAKAEGSSGNTPFTFTVTRTGNVSGATSFDYQVTGSGPNPADSADFGGTFPTGTVSFAANVASKTITLDVSGDTQIEPDDGFTVTISNATGGAIISTASATGVIQNDDVNQPPVLAANQSSVTVNEGLLVSNSGTWSDPDVPANTVTLSASTGTVTKNANGTWDWQIGSTDDVPATSVTITADDGVGGTATTTFTYTVANVAPTLTQSSNAVTGNVLTLLSNTGTYADIATDTVTLSASLGAIVKNNDGTWSWSILPSTAFTGQLVTITAQDEDGGSSVSTFTMDALVAISNRKVFYRSSGYETNGGVDGALDASKTILRASASQQTTTFANVSNYVFGINGLVLDVAGLASTSLTASDFTFRVAPAAAAGLVTPSTWLAAPAPSGIAVTPGTATTPARIKLDWANNAIQNTWLQIIVKANANTGLQQREVFYIGHALGEVDGVAPYRLSTSDVGTVRQGVGNAIVPVSDVRDVDKDRRITTSDVGFLRARVGNTVLLNTITIPVSGSGAEGETEVPLYYTILPALTAPAYEASTLPLANPPITARMTQRDYAVLPISIATIEPRNEVLRTVDLPPSGNAGPSATGNGTDATNELQMLNLDEYFTRLGRSRKLVSAGF